MSHVSPRQELSTLARSLRHYLMWQHDLGAHGIPAMSPEQAAELEAHLASLEERFAQAPAPQPTPHLPTPQPSSEDNTPKRTAPKRPSLVAPTSAPKPTITANPFRIKPARVQRASRTRNLAGDPSLQHIQQAIEGCSLCRLHHSRRSIVFGQGNPKADLLFIGPAPDILDDRTGTPFAEHSNHGKTLTRMIQAMGLQRNDVYITHIVKCRPPGHRSPKQDECASCRRFLLQQLRVVQPRVVVTLGPIAAQVLLNSFEPFENLQGRWHALQNWNVRPTLHPSQFHNVQDRRRAWNDLRAVMQRLQLKPKQKR